ncbi:MAG: hypothetical protein R3A13_07325 [Bdellovibrionota bacterium]
MSVKQNKILLITFLSFCFIPFSYAENNSELKMLQNKTAQQETLINQQQKVIEELLERVSRIEQGHTDAPKLKETIPAPRVKDTSSGSSTRVSLDEDELTSIQEISVEGDQQYPILEFNGYFDIGYADAGGDGSAASSSSTQVNSRGDTVSSLDIGGSSSFLVNEIEFGLTAHLSESTDAIVRADLLPRNTDFESSGSDSSSDTAEIDVAYIAHALELPDNLLLNNLFGDLVLSAGKLESAMGIEYRYNRSPDRVNISRSHQSVYSTGYPVGVRARGQLFKEHLNQFHNSNITYNLILGNSDPFISSADDNLDSNNNRTFQGRTSYGVDLFGGMFETGFSLLHGARGAQPDTNQETDFIAADARYENGSSVWRLEWQTADEDAPGGDTEKKIRCRL